MQHRPEPLGLQFLASQGGSFLPWCVGPLEHTQGWAALRLLCSGQLSVMFRKPLPHSPPALQEKCPVSFCLSIICLLHVPWLP